MTRSADAAVDLGGYLTPQLLDQLGDAVTVIGADWRYRFVSSAAAVIIGRPVEECVGQYVWDLFPEVVGTPQYDAITTAMAQRTKERFVWFFDTTERWYEQIALPVADGLVIVVNDITGQQEELRRSERLVEVGAALASAATVEQVHSVVIERVLPTLGACGGTLMLVDEERAQLVSVGWSGVDDAAARRFARTPLTARTPSVEAYRTGELVVASGAREMSDRFPDVAEAMSRMGRSTAAALPLSSAGLRLGTLALTFVEERQLTVGDRQFLSTTAAMVAQALLRARLLDAERRSLGEMQRHLLPSAIPEVPGLDVAVGYAASDQAVEVGGDWYDVVVLPDGGLGIVMGDIEGHDLAAAAAMGLVRSAVRAYAGEGHPPAVVLGRTNEFVTGLSLDRIVTLVYAQLHPRDRLVTCVSAGHPPPELVTADGTVLQVATEVGPPLGVLDHGMHWPETTSTLPRDSTVVLFTDGLVESRQDDIEHGLGRLRDVLRSHAEAGPDTLVASLLQARPARSDDVALLVARLTGPGRESGVLRRRLPATPASVFLARRFTRQLLEEWGLPDDVRERVELVTSELVTNAARDSEDRVDVGVARTESVLRLEVGDTSHRLPRATPLADEAAEEATSGRGLLLVEAVASRWGVVSEGLGKTVWAEFDLD